MRVKIVAKWIWVLLLVLSAISLGRPFWQWIICARAVPMRVH